MHEETEILFDQSFLDLQIVNIMARYFGKYKKYQKKYKKYGGGKKKSKAKRPWVKKANYFDLTKDGIVPKLKINTTVAKSNPEMAMKLMALDAHSDAVKRTVQRTMAEQKIQASHQKLNETYGKRLQNLKEQQKMLEAMDAAFGSLGGGLGSDMLKAIKIE